jgi:predicted nucleic acid-binding protein
MKLLDTTFLIHYWAGRESVKEYLDGRADTEFVTTTLNLKELATGRALQGQLNRHAIRSTFDWITILPFRFAHAIVAGELEAPLHADAGTNQDKINALTADVLTAAVAKHEGATVVTQNAADFQRFDGVAVETY